MTNQQFGEWVYELLKKDYPDEMTNPIKFAHAIRNKVIREVIEALPEKWTREGAPESISVWVIDSRNQTIDDTKQSLLNLLTKE